MISIICSIISESGPRKIRQVNFIFLFFLFMSATIHSALSATETQLVVPKTALLSVTDKTDIVYLAKALVQQNVMIISTG